MNLQSISQDNFRAIGAILVAMAVVALFETVVPLHHRGRWHHAHVGPNLALTFITFATNFVYNAALVLVLAWLADRDFGLLRLLPLHPLVAGVVAVVALDFSFYVTHVAMHKVPALWRVHRVHHSDPVVDVTTTIRQHPLEGVIRYAFLTVFACGLGVGLTAFAVYRVWSAVNALLEHANIRVPRRVDALLSLVTTWPNMHKVHHSRDVRQTDTNYGNIFCWFDHLFGTYTPSWQGTTVNSGLDGYDEPSMQTTAGLLAMPFREGPAASAAGSSPSSSRPTSRAGGALSPGESSSR
jgi:sterol desaturase/sphingolipid hydroxylase (fatty acid hydroxylase superfamily)